MSAFSERLRTNRPLAFKVGVAVGFYALLGFVLVPWLIERQITQLFDARLNLKTQVESIYFNPFSFYFEVQNLILSESDGSPLFALDHVHTNIDPAFLFLLKLKFAEVVVDGIEADFARFSEDSNTASVLAERWQASATEAVEPAPEANEDSALFPIQIDSVDIATIGLNLSDAVPETAFSTRVSLESLSFSNLSTIEGEVGNYTMTLAFEQNSVLTSSGEISISPLFSTGNVALQEFPLSAVSRYAQDSIPFLVEQGRFFASTEFDVEFGNMEPAVQLSVLSAAINDVRVTENGIESSVLVLESLSLNNGSLDTKSYRLDIESIETLGLTASADINTSGELNVSRLLNGISSDASDESATSSQAAQESSPWQISLNAFTLDRSSVLFEDNSLEQAFSMTTELSAEINDITNAANTAMPFQFMADFSSGGELALNGQAQVLPSIDFQSEMNLESIQLSVIQPYLNELAAVDFEQGQLNSTTTVISTSNEPLAVSGGIELSELLVSDASLNETLAQFDSLAIDAFEISLSESRIDVSELTLDSLFARIIINEDGSTNISRSIKNQPQENPEADTTNTSVQAEPLVITIGKVNIVNSTANFTDKDLPIEFNANIQALNGSAEGFASNSSQPTSLVLEGQVDEYGLLQIDSRINPFDFVDQSKIDVVFTNIDMPAMSPYVIKFAGREISEGTIDLGLDYQFESGALVANNSMELNDLKLGDRVEQEGAMNLPLDLAIALLKNGEGVIDLEVPISGDVNDPEFDFGPAIRRAITNVLTNVVAAPFRLLGSLVGGGDTTIDQVRFLPGRSDVAAPERQALAQLGEALTQRPQLVLEIPPVFAEEDRLVLQTEKIDQRIEETLATGVESDGLLTARRRSALETLYLDTGLTPSLAEVEASFTQVVETQTTSDSAAMNFDVIAYNAALRDSLISAEFVNDDELISLAEARADAVVNTMSEISDLDISRLRRIEIAQSELDDEGWLIMEFGLEPIP